MAKSLMDWIKIAGEVKALQSELQAAKADGKVTFDEAAGLASDVLGVLAKNQVTIEELQGLVQSLGPLLPLLKKLG